MLKIMKFAVLVVLALVSFAPHAFAQNCSTPPGGGFTPAWWNQYKAWCRACGGSICENYNDCAGRCTPGPNWGGTGGGGGGMPMMPMPAANSPEDMLMQGMMQGLMNGMMQGFDQGSAAAPPPQVPPPPPPRPRTPEEIERDRQAAAAAAARAEVLRIQQEQERERQRQEAARRERERQDRLDHEAFQQMSLLDAPFNTAKKRTTDSQPSLQCNQPTPQQRVCHVLTCGGGSNGPSVCCPARYPKLNYCDCKCYPVDAVFDCMQYADCNYSLDTKQGNP